MTGVGRWSPSCTSFYGKRIPSFSRHSFSKTESWVVVRVESLWVTFRPGASGSEVLPWIPNSQVRMGPWFVLRRRVPRSRRLEVVVRSGLTTFKIWTESRSDRGHRDPNLDGNHGPTDSVRPWTPMSEVRQGRSPGEVQSLVDSRSNRVCRDPKSRRGHVPVRDIGVGGPTDDVGVWIL